MHTELTEVCVAWALTAGLRWRCMRPSCPPVAVRPGRGRGWPPRPPIAESGEEGTVVDTPG